MSNSQHPSQHPSQPPSQPITQPASPLANQLQTISVALVEDDAGMQERLRAAILANASLDLQYCASNGAQILQWLKIHQPNVLLVDLGLPDFSGIYVIEETKKLSPNTEIMVITLFGDEANMIKAFEAGASGYLLKDGTEDGLAVHIMNLHAGGSPMSPIIARQLLARLKPKQITQPVVDKKQANNNLAEPLSPRETEILTLLARGYTYAELGTMLDLKFTTIHTHVRNIYGKLSVHSKTEAVFEARQLGLLDR